MIRKIEPVKKLKAVYLAYEDGSVIGVPEDKVLQVGTAFMKIVKKERFEWQVIKLKNSGSILQKVQHFFKI